jgi:hypothetical protein
MASNCLAFRRYALIACAVILAATKLSPLAAAESPDILRTESTRIATQHKFSAEDHALLDSIELGCFNFLWHEVGTPSGLVKDRRYGDVASLAGVGFQLSAIPIGVERGWITREQGQQRALQILRFLHRRNDIHKDGIYLHFVRTDSGDIYPPYRNEASTVDHSLFLAGAMPAAVYFGGEVAQIVDDIAARSNWKAFVNSTDGFLHMGWRPADNANMKGPGAYIERTWTFASDEERIIYFLAVAAPTPEFALEPRVYYRLQRTVERHDDLPPFVVSWNGIPFNYFFSHCWIDYQRFAADEPAEFGVTVPRVDWFENSRRALLTHRTRCLEVKDRFASFSIDRWGVSPCMGFNARDKAAYLVQGSEPNLRDADDWRLGTVAPYAAGGAIMFTPAESIAALRAFRQLKDKSGAPLVWRDPNTGGFAFADSFNLDEGRVSDDNVSIDVGPMLLAIENARTGLIWKLFMSHQMAKQGVDRLGWEPIFEPDFSGRMD